MKASPYRERFFNKFIPEPNTGCWLWTDAPNRKGYGELVVGKKLLRAHRVSWQIHNGEIKDGLHVLHKCDTPACVNPQHLFLGTNTDNAKDRSSKGRSFRPVLKTHCINGHEYTKENTVLYKRKNQIKRTCRTCKCAYLKKCYYKSKLKRGLS